MEKDNLSEEEKQAIESLRKNRGVSFAQADIILNLIEKQQKEIEIMELKEEIKKYRKRIYFNDVTSYEIEKKNCVSKKKIKKAWKTLEKKWTNGTEDKRIMKLQFKAMINKLLEE